MIRYTAEERAQIAAAKAIVKAKAREKLVRDKVTTGTKLAHVDEARDA